MRAFTALAAVLVVAAAIAGSAMAADPLLPFPSAKAGPVFIASHVTTTDGTMSSWFSPGDKVVFRAFAINRKTNTNVAAKDVKYFYVTIPGQPNVKLTYDKNPLTMKNMPWTGTWTVPSTFAGQVDFRMLIKLTSSKLKGEFTQMPITTAKLNIACPMKPKRTSWGSASRNENRVENLAPCAV